MKKGLFITFEGPEGAGKSTIIKKLDYELKNTRDYETLLTREPGGTRVGEAIRGILQHDSVDESLDPTAELLLFESSRAQLVNTVIMPALEKGVWVLCDRFMDSSTAYQGYGRGFGYKQVELANNFAVGDCIPDLTLLLDLPIEVGFERLKNRKGENGKVGAKDRMEREAREFHERVRAGYLDIAKRNPNRFIVINGNQIPDKVYEDTYQALVKRLSL